MHVWDDLLNGTKNKWNSRAGSKLASLQDWETLRIIVFTDKEDPFEAVRDKFPEMKKKKEICEAAKRSVLEVYKKNDKTALEGKAGTEKSISIMLLENLIEKMKKVRSNLGDLGDKPKLLLKLSGGEADIFKLYYRIAIESLKSRIWARYNPQLAEQGISEDDFTNFIISRKSKSNKKYGLANIILQLSNSAELSKTLLSICIDSYINKFAANGTNNIKPDNKNKITLSEELLDNLAITHRATTHSTTQNFIEVIKSGIDRGIFSKVASKLLQLLIQNFEQGVSNVPIYSLEHQHGFSFKQSLYSSLDNIQKRIAFDGNQYFLIGGQGQLRINQQKITPEFFEDDKKRHIIFSELQKILSFTRRILGITKPQDCKENLFMNQHTACNLETSDFITAEEIADYRQVMIQACKNEKHKTPLTEKLKEILETGMITEYQTDLINRAVSKSKTKSR